MKKQVLKMLTLIFALTLLFALPMSAEDYRTGDMDGDGEIVSHDAIYLLRHILLPQKYPIFQAADLNGDGKISYVMFMGEKGNNEAIYRTQYSIENANKKLSAADLPKLSFYDASNKDNYLLDKDGKWSAQAANEYMTTLLSSYNPANGNMVELVICNNDGMAEGAISALPLSITRKSHSSRRNRSSWRL